MESSGLAREIAAGLEIPFAVPDEGELELADRAGREIAIRRRAGRHTTVALLRGESGEDYLGIDLVSRKSSVCAEPSAMAAAVLGGEQGMRSIVAACLVPSLERAGIISPCGACRELIALHAPGCRIILESGSGLVAVEAGALFPFPWPPH